VFACPQFIGGPVPNLLAGLSPIYWRACPLFIGGPPTIRNIQPASGLCCALHLFHQVSPFQQVSPVAIQIKAFQAFFGLPLKYIDTKKRKYKTTTKTIFEIDYF
jgi:hypothetical protein